MAHSLALLTTLLVGGALADRYSRRMLMIASDVARFIVIGALTVVDAGGGLSFALLLVFAVGFGLADGFSTRRPAASCRSWSSRTGSPRPTR